VIGSRWCWKWKRRRRPKNSVIWAGLTKIGRDLGWLFLVAFPSALAFGYATSGAFWKTTCTALGQVFPSIGCCGWTEKQSLYLTHFPVIEIQSTFYHPPAAKVAAKWRELAPPHFTFCIKAWQLITHTPSSPTYRRLRFSVAAEDRDHLGLFRDTEQVWQAWKKTLEVAEVLQVAVVVFQCPASFQSTPMNLQNFSTFFRKIGQQAFRIAWEPRGSWPPELVRDLCAEFQLIHCVDPFINRSVYGDPLYWRLHGKKGYSYRYTDEDLEYLREILANRSAFVMFNNVSMKEDALRFRRFYD
jgi:uncharacterized protein YecE (DUF72 family)